jgi:putative transposase
LNLAIVMDPFLRRVLGWAMDAHVTEALTHRALMMAVTTRQTLAVQVMHHSDRGSQYTTSRMVVVPGSSLSFPTVHQTGSLTIYPH